MRCPLWLRSHTLCVALLLGTTPGSHAESPGTSKSLAHTRSFSTSTCPAGTVNYITHVLPQQCLAPTRSPASSPPNSTTITSSSSVKSSPTNVSKATSSFSPSPVSTVTPTLLPTETANTTTDNATPTPNATTTAENTATTTETPVSVLTASPSAHVISQIIVSSSEDESESPLDNVKFLSFEEWKNQNLAQAGQSADAIGQGRRPAAGGQNRENPAHTNGLDTLGEDSEIELNFGGFGGVANSASVTTQDPSGTEAPGKSTKDTSASSQRPLSKDAGKTCKERFNYASFDCAANVLKTNPRCKKSSSILVENKDSYMLNECSVENKFIIVELCDDILVDTVVLANFEFFSSMFRTFRITVSDRYPVKQEKWKVLGTFEARNSREIQAFLIENPLIWARYLRVEFLTHFGSEFYCPVSLLRVHGTTMMEEYRREERAGGEGEEDDEEIAEVEDTQISVPQPVFSPEVIHKVDESHVLELDTQTLGELSEAVDCPTSSSAASTNGGTSASNNISVSQTASTSITTSPESSSVATDSIVISQAMTSPHDNDPTSDTSSAGSTTGREPSSMTMSDISLASMPSPPNSSSIHSSSASASVVPSVDAPIISTSLTATTNSTKQSAPASSIPSSTSSIGSISTSSSPTATVSGQAASFASSSHSPVPVASSSSSVPASSSTTVTNQSTKSSKHNPASATASLPATPSQPATQESFFKSIHKRLQSLESNSTLSLQYIESQSQLLQSALSSMSKHQQTKIAHFLETLNSSVSSELSRFKQDYDQLWQSTVLELAAQREDGRREHELLGERIRLLAEEMVGQKRIMAAQATALLFCAGLLIFTRFLGSSNVASRDLGLLPNPVIGTGVTIRNEARHDPLSASGSRRGMSLSPSSPATARRRWKWGRGSPTLATIHSAVKVEPALPSPAHTKSENDEEDLQSAGVTTDHDFEVEPGELDVRPSSAPMPVTNGLAVDFDESASRSRSTSLERPGNPLSRHFDQNGSGSGSISEGASMAATSQSSSFQEEDSTAYDDEDEDENEDIEDPDAEDIQTPEATTLQQRPLLASIADTQSAPTVPILQASEFGNDGHDDEDYDDS